MPLVDHDGRDRSVNLVWELGADPTTVWRHLTDVERLPEWLGRRVEGGFVPWGTDLVVDHGDGHLSRSTIMGADEGQNLTMTWEFPDEPPSTVMFVLRAGSLYGQSDDGGTVLRLTHDDLGDLTATYLPGWITHLTFFEASLSGHPLPREMFWRLYETTEHLTALMT